MSALGWGVLGVGRIAHDFVQALRTLEPGEHEVIAAGSRSLERCTEFCKELGIPRSYGSYEELLEDKEVQAVYIATRTSKHFENVVLAIKTGKPILCEKPMTMNLADLQQITNQAKENNVLLMEAVWTRFIPLWQDLLQMIGDGKIGEVKVVMASFGGQSMENSERMYDPKEGGSALLDIGIYVLTVTDMVFGGEEPLSITASGHKFETGVDHTVGINILYSRNRIAHVLISAGADLPNDCKIIGTKGSLTVNTPFWCPVSATTPDGLVESPLPSTSKPTVFINSAGLRYEIAAFGDYIKEKKKESSVMSHDTSMRIMRWMDEIRRQMGVPLTCT